MIITYYCESANAENEDAVNDANNDNDMQMQMVIKLHDELITQAVILSTRTEIITLP